MNRRDALKTGLTGAAVLAAGTVPTYATEVTPEHVDLLNDRDKYGPAKYWNVKVDRWDQASRGIRPEDLEALNAQYARIFQDIGWEVVHTTIAEGPDSFASHLQGLIVMDKQQDWERTISESLMWADKDIGNFQRLGGYETYYNLQRQLSGKYVNGFESDKWPSELILHAYYINQRLKNDIWDDGKWDVVQKRLRYPS